MLLIPALLRLLVPGNKVLGVLAPKDVEVVVVVVFCAPNVGAGCAGAPNTLGAGVVEPNALVVGAAVGVPNRLVPVVELPNKLVVPGVATGVLAVLLLA